MRVVVHALLLLGRQRRLPALCARRSRARGRALLQVLDDLLLALDSLLLLLELLALVL